MVFEREGAWGVQWHVKCNLMWILWCTIMKFSCSKTLFISIYLRYIATSEWELMNDREWVNNFRQKCVYTLIVCRLLTTKQIYSRRVRSKLIFREARLTDASMIKILKTRQWLLLTDDEEMKRKQICCMWRASVCLTTHNRSINQSWRGQAAVYQVKFLNKSNRPCASFMSVGGSSQIKTQSMLSKREIETFNNKIYNLIVSISAHKFIRDSPLCSNAVQH